MAKNGRTWWWRVAIAVVVLRDVYVGSYAVLYYRGVSEMNAVGLRFFFYVQIAEVVEVRRVTRRHVLLAALYEPLNNLHGRWLGGRSACRNITFGPSADHPKQQVPPPPK